MSELELQILTALREHMVVSVMLIDKLIDMPTGSNIEVIAEGGCPHPEEKRQDANRMGWKGFMCGVCKEIIEEPIA